MPHDDFDERLDRLQIRYETQLEDIRRELSLIRTMVGIAERHEAEEISLAQRALDRANNAIERLIEIQETQAHMFRVNEQNITAIEAKHSRLLQRLDDMTISRLPWWQRALVRVGILSRA